MQENGAQKNKQGEKKIKKGPTLGPLYMWGLQFWDL